MTEYLTSVKAKVAILPGVLIGLIAGLHPLVWGLFALQVLDILSGVVARKASISSALANSGMNKKVFMWLYVLTGHLLKTISPVPIDFPVDAMIAGYYCVVEVISIMENGGRIGMDAPAPLARIVKILTKFTVETEGAIETSTKTTTVVIEKPAEEKER